MIKRTFFHGISLLMLAVAVFAPGSALAAVTGISGPTEMREDCSAVFTATGSTAVDYQWDFDAGTPTTQVVLNSASITWLADVVPEDEYDPAVVNVTVQGLTDATSYARTIKVYRPVSIRYKDYIPGYILPGKHSRSEYGEDSLSGTGGRYATYQWIFTGPAWATYYNGGENKVALFTAPTTGMYAGKYTITLQDGLPGVDSVDIYVPCRIEQGPIAILEGSQPVVYTITGMPDGVNYTARLMTGTTSTATDVTGSDYYGTITPQTGPSVGGVYTLTYTPPLVDYSGYSKFYIVCEPDQNLDCDSYGNVYRPLPFGPLIVRDTRRYSGQLRDTTTGNAIAGAKVSLYAPAPYRRVVYTDNNGEFSMGSLPDGNVYALSVSAQGYINGLISSQYLTTDVPDHAQFSIDQASAAYVSGAIFRPDGTPLGDDEDAVVTLVHKYFDNGLTYTEVLGELPLVGSNYFLGLSEVPAKPSKAGTDEYYVEAYTDGQYTEYMLPDGAGFPVVGLNLTLSTNYGGQAIGALPTTDAGTPVPVTGGFRVDAVNTMKDLVTYDVIGYYPAGFIEVPPAGIDTDELTGTPIGANMYGEVIDNQNGDDIPRDSFVSAVPSLLYVELRDDDNSGNNELTGKGLRVMMPIDLVTTGIGTLDSGNLWIRTAAGTELDLKSCNSTHIGVSEIYALDYLGDGRTGSVYFSTPSRARWFGAGGQCSDSNELEGEYSFAPFERYEVFGCFVDTVMPGAEGRKNMLAGLVAAALLLVGLMFIRRG